MSTIFFKDNFEGTAHASGFFFRAFDLVKFIDKVENQGMKVVGLKFEGNNVELITEKNDER